MVLSEFSHLHEILFELHVFVWSVFSLAFLTSACGYKFYIIIVGMPISKT